MPLSASADQLLGEGGEPAQVVEPAKRGPDRLVVDFEIVVDEEPMRVSAYVDANLDRELDRMVGREATAESAM